MRTTTRLWRWRRNPLRRRSDILDAWLGLVVVAAVLIGAPAVGVGTGLGLHTLLRESAERQAAQRQHTPAILLEDAPDSASAGDVVLGGYGGTVGVRVRWTAPGGTTRTGRAQVEPGLAAGSTTAVWTDRRGELTSPPLDVPEARSQAVTLGAIGALVSATSFLVGGRTLRRRLKERRIAAWGTAWARIEPQWSHRLT